MNDSAINKNNNAINLTIKFTALEALLSLVNNLKNNINNLSKISNIHMNKVNTLTNTPMYFPYTLSQGIIDCIKVILPDLNQRKTLKYTRNLSLGIGLITSCLVSIGFNGLNYYISFSLNLFKTTVTTLIIDRLNRLNTIDGVSVAVLLNIICSLPNIIATLSSTGLITTLLFIASISAMNFVNYKSLKSTEDNKEDKCNSKYNTRIHYKDKIDNFSINNRNTYTTSLFISNFVSGFVANLMPMPYTNPLIQSGLTILINPLIQLVLGSNSVDLDELNKNLAYNNIYINGLKHGKETKDYLRKMILKNNIKLGIVGALVFILSSLIIKIFMVNISPIVLAVMVNSFINIKFSVMSMVKCKRIEKVRILNV